jgi:rare lipoprotein A
MKTVKYSCLIIIVFIMPGCSTVSHHNRYYGRDGAPDFNIDISRIPDAVPRVEPRSKYGNPASYNVDGQRYCVMKSAEGYCQTGIASWYGMRFYKQRTSSGEPYDVAGMTAASKVLPLPTYVQVTNLQNNKKVIVKVNDRGPFHANRIIDLSYVAARKLGMFPKGTALVEVRAIDPAHPESAAPVRPSLAPAPADARSGAPEIYLQLGAFRDQHNAQNLASKVKTHTYYPVLVKTADKNGLPVYRVQIGPIPTVDNTDNLHDSLEKAGLGEPITVIQ